MSNTKLRLAALIVAMIVTASALSEDGDYLGVMQAHANARGEARDAQGNRYITFYFSGTIDVDPGPGELLFTQTDGLNGSQGSCYLAKFSPSGALLWARHISNAEDARLAADAQGNSYVSVWSQDDITVENGDTPIVLQHEYLNAGAAVFSFDSDGNYVWHRRLLAAAGRRGGVDLGWIRIDSQGRLLVSGSFASTVDADPGPDELIFEGTDGAPRTFLLWLAANGDFVNARQMWLANNYLELTGDDGFMAGGGGGLESGDIDPGPDVRLAGGQEKKYIARYDENGDLVWANVFDAYPLNLTLFAQDAEGNVFITGFWYRGQEGIDLDPGTGEAWLPGGMYSGDRAYLAKYGPDGEFIWLRHFEGAGFINEYDTGVYGQFVLPDGAGGAYITGKFDRRITLGSGFSAQTLDPVGGFDQFIAHYSTDGELLWAKQLASAEDDAIYAAFAFPSDGLYLWGSIMGDTMDVDPGPSEVLLAKSDGPRYQLHLEASGDVPPPPHSADVDGDWRISLAELLRLIQFYNSAGLHCAAASEPTEDGYQPGSGDQECAPHDSDYDPIDGVISLSELLQAIQLYNASGYLLCSPAALGDGYCPILP